MVSSDYFNRHNEWWFDTEEAAYVYRLLQPLPVQGIGCDIRESKVSGENIET